MDKRVHISREVAKEQLVNQTHLPNIEGAYDREGLKITNFSETVGIFPF